MRDAFQTFYLYLVLCLFIFPYFTGDAHSLLVKKHDEKRLGSKKLAEPAHNSSSQKNLVYPDSLSPPNWTEGLSSNHRSMLPSFVKLDENDKTSLGLDTLGEHSNSPLSDVNEEEDKEWTALPRVDEAKGHEKHPDGSKKCIRKHITHESSSPSAASSLPSDSEETLEEYDSEKTHFDDESGGETKEMTHENPEPTWRDVIADIKDKAIYAKEHLIGVQTTTMTPSAITKDARFPSLPNNASPRSVMTSTKSGVPTWIWCVIAVVVLGAIGGVLYLFFSRDAEPATSI